MTDLLNLLFNPLPNGIMTILMGFSLLYWIFQFLLGDGLDFGGDSDFHFGDISEVDADADLHSETDLDASETGEPSFFTKCLDFINVGKVPLMIIITLFKFFSWVITLVSTTLLGLAAFGSLSVLVLIPVFIIVFILMHWVTEPLVKAFKELGYHGEEETDFIGRIGTMKSTIEGDKIGSAEFYIDKDIFTLNVKSISGDKIAFGETVIISDEEITQKYYLVAKHLTLNSI